MSRLRIFDDADPTTPLSSTCRVNRPEPATKNRTSSSLWKCSSRNLRRISSRLGLSGAMLTTSTVLKPRSDTRRSMSER